MKTTAEDFEIFKSEAMKWIVFFGLADWEVHFFHEFLDHGMGATTQGWFKSKNAEIKLNKEWPKEYKNEYQIRLTAFHEVCELLLMELRILAQCRYLAEDDIDHATHTIIQRLVNTVFKTITFGEQNESDLQ